MISSSDFPDTYPDFLPVMEHFYTLQGEGKYAGQAAYFIRLAGCDVACTWCDVKESWEISQNQWMSVKKLAEIAAEHPSRLVVITGGEPFMYDLSKLIYFLHQQGFKVHIETSGAYDVTGDADWICVSPKKFKTAIPKVVALAHELKIIVYNASDFKWAEKYAQLVNPDCKLYLQVEWSKKEVLNGVVIDYIQSNPQWNLSIQTHKYLDIP